MRIAELEKLSKEAHARLGRALRGTEEYARAERAAYDIDQELGRAIADSRPPVLYTFPDGTPAVLGDVR